MTTRTRRAAPKPAPESEAQPAKYERVVERALTAAEEQFGTVEITDPASLDFLAETLARPGRARKAAKAPEPSATLAEAVSRPPTTRRRQPALTEANQAKAQARLSAPGRPPGQARAPRPSGRAPRPPRRRAEGRP